MLFLKNKIAIIFLVIFIILVGCAAGYASYQRSGFIAAGEGKKKLPEIRYDLLVVGSDPEGIAAAVSGARNGLRTLLVDLRPEPGGLITRGWLNTIDMNYGPGREILNKGIFLEFYQQIKSKNSFDPEMAAKAFHSLMSKERNLQLLLNVQDIKPCLERVNDKIVLTGVSVILPDGLKKDIFAARVIDATQDADLAAAAGVPYTTGLSDCGRPDERIAVTLIFKLKGVGEREWGKLQQAIIAHREPHTGADAFSAWGFAKIMKEYRPANNRLGVRGLNIGRLQKEQVLINALQIFGVDPLSLESRAQARLFAEQEIPRLIEYLKRNIPGLESASLEGFAPELYVRDSRHIQGLYRLSINDVMENKDFWDRIAFGSYPVDIQATSPYFTGDIIGVPVKYAIPFRCLVPREVEKLLVIGRSTSFDALAAGSARVVPVGMATGQAAGTAAALSIEEDLFFQEMSASPRVIAELQNRLNSQGMEIKPFQAAVPWGDHWAYSGLKFMRQWGLASGGYTNDYRLDEEMKEESFLHGLSAALRMTGTGVSPEIKTYPRGQELTLKVAAQIMCAARGLLLSPGEAYQYLAGKGFWEQAELRRLQKEGKISRGAGYLIIMRFLEDTPK